MVLECPKCYGYIEPNWDYCSACGTKLNSKDNMLYVYEREEWAKKHGWNGKEFVKKKK